MLIFLFSLLACSGEKENLEPNQHKHTIEETSELIILSVTNGELDQLEKLIKNNSIINKPSKIGITPLIAAIKAGKIEVIQYLIEKGADVNQASMGLTPLASGIYKNDIRSVKLLLNSGADPNKKSHDHSPLTFAILNNNKQIINELIIYKANVNGKDSFDGMTELMKACLSKDASIVQLLISSGADLNAKVKGKDISVLGFASMVSNDKIIKILIDNNAIFNQTEKSKALCLSIIRNNKSTNKYLISKGAKIDPSLKICQKALSSKE